MVALWLVAPGEPLPIVPPYLNQPFTDDDTRGVHFWLEPIWHTLLVQRLPNTDDVRLIFYEEHMGGLCVCPDDFRFSKQTLFDRVSVSRFVNLIYTSFVSVRNQMDLEP